DIISIIALHLRGVKGVCSQDSIFKSGGEPLYLRFNGLRHICGRAVGYMAVRPAGMLSIGCPATVENALLGKQDNRLFGMVPVPNVLFCAGDLFKRVAQVYGTRPSCGTGRKGYPFA